MNLNNNPKTLCRCLFIGFLLLLTHQNLYAQFSALPGRKQKTERDISDTTHNVKLALLRSAIVPGWGQAYNHKWWKATFIYTGLGFLGSSIISSHRDYQYYLSLAKIGRKGASAETDLAQKDNQTYQQYKNITAKGASQSALEEAANNAQRNYQISILGIAGVWALQVLDAYIDAKMRHSYSMDDNFAINLRPGLVTTYSGLNTNTAFSPALTLTYNIR